MKSLLQIKGPALNSSKRAIDRGEMCCGGSHAGIEHNNHDHGILREEKLMHLQQQLDLLKEEDETYKNKLLFEEEERARK